MNDEHNGPNGAEGNDETGFDQPYIPASTILSEITVKAVFLGVILSIVLAGANAYLGLLAGMTVSASIPAAVISMAVLRMFARSNILENNIVQTAASAGESLVAGVIFTIPALVLLGAWDHFNYWETTLIAGFGGLLGVLFTIPLRRALIVENPLKFPEGVATAEVLEVGDTGGAGVRSLAWGGAIGAIFKLGSSGARLWEGKVAWAANVKGSIAYFGSELAPALVGVGYIVGINIAVLVFLGGAMNWLIAIPIVASDMDWPVYQTAEQVETLSATNPQETWMLFEVPSDEPEMLGKRVPAVEWADQIWSARTRFLGVGAMLIGGVWALIRLARSLISGIRAGIRAYQTARGGGDDTLLRTERDAPMQWVGIAGVISLIPLFLVFAYFLTHPDPSGAGESGITTGAAWALAGFMAVIMMIAGFLFSSVAAYMAGLVGSSNNPISGVTIATVLTSSLLLLIFLGEGSPIGPMAAIAIGAVVCCAAAIGGDNMQDLKAGHMVGATPYKQQIMQAVGVISAAFVIAPILNLLHTSYGIGIQTNPEEEPLSAPQATLMQSVADGVFNGGLPWGYIAVGMVIAALVIIGDLFLEARRSSFRMPVLAVAVGVYLPFELSVPILIGGLIAWGANRYRARRTRAIGEEAGAEARKESTRAGMLFAAGLITGEALLGILLAVPIAAFGGRNPLALSGEAEGETTYLLERAYEWPGVALLIVVGIVLYRVATSAMRKR